MNPSSLSTNILATLVVLIMVFVMPWADRKICAGLGLNLQGGVSSNPAADRLLKLRRMLLWAILIVYMAGFLYLALLSRSSQLDYRVHVAPLEDLQNAVSFDTGLFRFLRALLFEGVSAAREHITVISPEDIAQFYLNIIVFVPMGFLLPYVIEWFRARVRTRPVIACFIISLATENLQLITRRGFYDVDDIISNTLGGLLGELLFIAVGYVVTHPHWRSELRQYRRWKRNARHRTLYPFARRIGYARVTLTAGDEIAVWNFYVTKLGFRPRRQIVREDSAGTDFLLSMGRMELAIRCTNAEAPQGKQYLTFTAQKLDKIKKRLSDNGIETSPFEQDPLTGLRQLRFTGPDNVEITLIEK